MRAHAGRTESASRKTLKRYARLRGEARQRQHCSLKLLVETTRIVAHVIDDIVYQNLLSWSAAVCRQMRRLNAVGPDYRERFKSVILRRASTDRPDCSLLHSNYSEVGRIAGTAG